MKEPKNLKVPYNFKVSVETQKLYAAYLWFKQMAPYGSLPKKSLQKHRHKAYYWGKKLVQQGWVEDRGTSYHIKTYQFVWHQLGVETVNRRKRTKKGIKIFNGYGFKRISPMNFEGNFLKKTFEEIQCLAVETYKAQVTGRLTTTLRKSREYVQSFETPLLSVYGAMRILGYKSASSGHKYREKYFDLVKPPLVLKRRWCERTEDVRVMYPCYKIKLSKVYHDVNPELA